MQLSCVMIPLTLRSYGITSSLAHRRATFRYSHQLLRLMSAMGDHNSQCTTARHDRTVPSPRAGRYYISTCFDSRVLCITPPTRAKRREDQKLAIFRRTRRWPCVAQAFPGIMLLRVSLVRQNSEYTFRLPRLHRFVTTWMSQFFYRSLEARLS